MKRIRDWLHHLGHYVGKPWYPFLVGVLAALDQFILIIPTDGILISSSLASKKKWWIIALATTIGSTLAAILLAFLVQEYGHDFVEWVSPGAHHSSMWENATQWIDRHGIWALFGIAALPVFQLPGVCIAGLAELPLTEITIAVFFGRLLKNCVFGSLAAYAPDFILRFKVVKKEVELVTETEELSPGPFDEKK